MIPNFVAFTTSGKGRLNVLKSNVEVLTDKKINPDSVKQKYDAIWDTGATNTVISNRVANEMKLIPIGMVTVSTANGVAEAYKYIISLVLPNKLVIEDIEVTSGNLGEGVDLLIGMDIISLGDFAITNVNNKTVFSFRFPSCKTVDYCKEASILKLKRLEREIKEEEKIIKQHGNEKCPCGSGKKYRYCCGKSEIEKLKNQLSKKEMVR